MKLLPRVMSSPPCYSAVTKPGVMSFGNFKLVHDHDAVESTKLQWLVSSGIGKEVVVWSYVSLHR